MTITINWSWLLDHLFSGVAAFGTLYAIWRVKVLHVQVNSRMDALLDSVSRAAFAKGVKSETDKEK